MAAVWEHPSTHNNQLWVCTSFQCSHSLVRYVGNFRWVYIIYCISHFETKVWFDKLCGFLSFLTSNYDLVPRLDSLCVPIYLIISCLGKVRLYLDAMCVCTMCRPNLADVQPVRAAILTRYVVVVETFCNLEINFKFVKFYKRGLNLIFQSLNQFKFNRDVPVFFGHLFL